MIAAETIEVGTDPVGLVAVVVDYAIVVSLPLLVVLVWTVIDIWRRPGVHHRALWTLGCLLFWPAMLAYFALRPLADGGNRRYVGSQGDARAALVVAVIDHEGPGEIAGLRPPG